ncbi:class I SAM-dependent methyltransferase [Vibrio sp. PP-XX7]
MIHTKASSISAVATGLLGIHFKDIFAQVHLVDASHEMLRVAQSKLTAARINNVAIHAVDGLTALPQPIRPLPP